MSAGYGLHLLCGGAGIPVCLTSYRSSRPASISCFHAAAMKRVLSTGDIASSPIGDNSIDNGGPFTLQNGRRKKQSQPSYHYQQRY